MKKMSIKKIIIFSTLCIAVIGSIFIYSAQAGNAEYTEETAEIRNVEVYNSYEGNIESADAQEIYATSTSTMKKIYVSEGDRVKKGDLLYELEGDNTESRLTQAQASAASAEIAFHDAQTNLQRITELYETGAVSQLDYEKAKSSLDNAVAQLSKSRADYDIAENDIADLRKYAEIDGEVSDINVDENDTMLSGTEIMNVINYDKLIVKIKIDEFDLGAVTEGDPAEVVITALDKSVSGTISEITKKAEVVNGVSYFNAEVVLKPDTTLKIGLSTEVRIIREQAGDAVTITMKAVKFDEKSQPYVLIRNSDGKIETRKITVGINDGSIVQIKDGLNAGEQVLLEKTDNKSKVSLLPPSPDGSMPEDTAQ